MRFWNDIFRFPARLRDQSWKERPLETQERIFKRLIHKNRDTVFGKQYNFHLIHDYSEFQTGVPVFSYEELFPYIERMTNGEKNVLVRGPVSTYAKSSGTTNDRSKYIPTPKRFLKKNHLKAGKDIVVSYMKEKEGTQIALGKTIAITGSISSIEGTDSKAGDISALICDALPWWTSHTRPYTKELALHSSWPHKAGEIAKNATGADVVSLYGVPTWMLEILELILKESGKTTIKEVWPNIEVFFWGGVAFAPYKKRYEALIGNPDFEFRGVYNASEGVIAYEDDPKGHPGEALLCTDHDVFYEFIPMNNGQWNGKDAVPLKDVQIGIRYAVLMSTTSGLWRYLIGDVVEFTSTSPYRLKIVGRTTQFMNAFGEEVVLTNVVEAIRRIGVQVREFTAAPTFSAIGSQGAHEWVFEFVKKPDDIEKFIDALDTELKKINSDYEAKRDGNTVLGRPIVHIVPEGTFRRYMEQRGKLGGQNKVPSLSSERMHIQAILDLASQ